MTETFTVSHVVFPRTMTSENTENNSFGEIVLGTQHFCWNTNIASEISILSFCNSYWTYELTIRIGL